MLVWFASSAPVETPASTTVAIAAASAAAAVIPAVVTEVGHDMTENMSRMEEGIKDKEVRQRRPRFESFRPGMLIRYRTSQPIDRRRANDEFDDKKVIYWQGKRRSSLVR